MIRHFLLVFILCSVLIPWSVYSQKTEKRPKVGLVLSGGGAKGFAEIGVLKVLEENDIPIDYIAGTSIGAIIGGAYAMGYNATALDSIVRTADWLSLMNDHVNREHFPIFVKEEDSRYYFSIPISKKGLELPKGILDGQNVLKFFSDLCFKYEGDIDFDQLPIPFRCVASDILTGEEVVISHGNLKNAIRASMAIPGVFTPVDWNDHMLLDGLMVNNFPVDVCRDMGADVIIGVDIQARLLKRDEIKSVYSILDNATTWMAKDTYELNKNDCDLYLRPPIEEYAAMDFQPELVDSLIRIGEDYARKILPKLIQFRDSLGLRAERKNLSKVLPRGKDRYFISGIEVNGADKVNKREVLGRLQIDAGVVSNLNQIHRGVDQIYGTGYYNQVTYELKEDGYGGYILSINVDEADNAWLNVGAHYNTENNAGLLINTTVFGRSTFGSRLSSDLILSHRSSFSLKYNMDRGHHIGLGSNFMVKDERLPLYDSYGRVNGEIDYMYITFNVDAHSIIYDRMLIGFGVGQDWYNVSNVVSSSLTDDDVSDETFSKMFVYLKYDSKDRAYFANNGWEVNGNLMTLVKDVFSDNSFADHLILQFNVKKYISFSEYFTWIPYVNSRFVTWDEMPCYLMTAIGGDTSTSLLSNQIPFNGLRNMQILTKNGLIFGSDFRFKIFKDNYITALINVALNVESFTNSMVSTVASEVEYPLYGASLKYSYDSPIGPVELSVGSSSQSSRVNAFFSIGYWF
ncbi:patatin-like phospholipase family protein [Halosquirtibacter laminarini]|uniref:Patatin-like phospholipase family protein n=1 Tax=Halosquirtibacter laminarini TaxID=3374600 RepID=A0AC61NCF8_9BACT|nr:patatin-like phospholipase family protein [Prolixibacteraceae bacterium]